MSRLEFRNIILVLFTDEGTFKATNTNQPRLILAEPAHGVAEDLYKFKGHKCIELTRDVLAKGG